MTNRVFISTSIPYVNGDPHIGHALEFVQSDVLARYYRVKEGEENVFFLSGTDENALKNVLAAQKEGVSTREYVEEKSGEFRKLKDLLNISFDDFIQTTEKRHFEGASKLWKSFKKEDVYKDSYEGLYCVGCEEFKLERDLVDGKCPEHNVEPEPVSEENYFFKLSNYQDEIQDLIENDKIRIVPEKRKNEVLGFIREGLQDFSISRSVERAKGWGVPVPGDESQIMFVWVDALSNYITALDYVNGGKLYQDFWEESERRIHVIGKGIVKFHALYWIGMLLSAGLPLPTEEFVHGYVTVEGNKIGKSLGNAIHPKEVSDKYGADVFRYYLLKEIPSYNDGDFSWSRMDEVYTADLANGLGNLVSRVSAMAEGAGVRVESEETSLSQEMASFLDEYRFDKAIESVWSRIREADSYINQEKVWELKGEEKERALKKLISQVRQVAFDLQVFLPQTAEKISTQFAGPEIKKGEALFPRLQ